MSSKKDANEVLLERVVQARKAAAFSLSQAAGLLEFKNYQTLSQIEKGTRNITAHELGAMARIYGRDLEYFFLPNIRPDPKPLWRKSAEVNVEKIQREFLHFLENYSNMENLLKLRRRWKNIQKGYDRSDFLSGGFKLVGEVGAEIGHSLGLGSRPAFNLLNVLENDLRIKVLHLELQNGISGASVVDDDLGVGILINSKDVPWRRNYDLAHELFHIITWKVFSHREVGDGVTKTKPEQYADNFASSLLLPEPPLRKSLEEVTSDGQIRIVDIIELAKDFGVSTAAILWRLVNLQVLEKSEVQEILANTKIKNSDRVMRKGLYYKFTTSKFPTRYISLACRCLVEGKISRGTFARYLDINRAEIDTFLEEQGFMEKTYEKIASARC